jgi:arylsulfatase A-like enzyme
MPCRFKLINPRIVPFAAQPERSIQPRERMKLPNVVTLPIDAVLYLGDTLGADHHGMCGYHPGVSPHIDSFARDAVVFRRAIAQTQSTRASAASILTGMPPIVHHVEDSDDALASEATTLAEMLRTAGYQTSAIVANENVASEFGFDQGIDHFLYLRGKDSGAPTVHGGFLEWLDGRSQSSPFFACVHTVNPHSSYRAPDVFHKEFSPGIDRKLGGVPFLKELQLHRGPVPPDLPGKIRSLYDSTVAFADAEFGKLIDELKQRGIYDQTLIVFVSDHGEEFYVHGNWEHGKILHAEVIDVPLSIDFLGHTGLGLGRDRPASQPHAYRTDRFRGRWLGRTARRFRPEFRAV